MIVPTHTHGLHRAAEFARAAETLLDARSSTGPNEPGPGLPLDEDRSAGSARRPATAGGLVVDDDPRARSGLEQLLVHAGGCVDTAEQAHGGTLFLDELGARVLPASARSQARRPGSPPRPSA